VVSEIVTAVISLIGGIVLASFTPLGQNVVRRHFLAPPIFAPREPSVPQNLSIIIDALSSRARRFLPLGVESEGIIITNAAQPVITNGTVSWKVNLRDRRFRGFFRSSQGELRLRFFTSPGEYSEIVRLLLPEDYEETLSSKEIEDIRISSYAEFLKEFRSYRRLHLDAARLNIAYLNNHENKHIHWSEAHDGAELHVQDARTTSVQSIGKSELLTDSMYSWVVRFVRCCDLNINGLVMGHAPAGQCAGGVIAFSDCAKVKIQDCEALRLRHLCIQH
jgi:hypothetical protein